MHSPELQQSRFPTLLLIAFVLATGSGSVYALGFYAGHWYVYLLFSLLANALLAMGFRKKAIFFDAFIGVFFWLGFWLKLTLRIIFTKGQFSEAVGMFDHSGSAFDHGLLVASCGMLALILASLLRQHYFHYADKHDSRIYQPGLYAFYCKHRKTLWLSYFSLAAFIAFSNLYFGIYQRGEVAQTILPFHMSGVYKWLLLFGLSAFAALMFKFEYVINQKRTLSLALISLLESCLTNVSLLSRGMILNTSALFYGLMTNLRLRGVRSRIRFFGVVACTFIVLFVGSVLTVNYLRSEGSILALMGAPSVHQESGPALSTDRSISVSLNMAPPLFVDRWVGIEGVLAVSSHEGLGWDLWRQAWAERYTESSTSFYDLNLITSPYLTMDSTKNHFISLPGIVAFCFYPGSFLFLFFAMLVTGLAAGVVEFLVFRFCGRNLIICSLFGQIVAYRLCSFGYVPNQTYLLFGSIGLNIVLIYLAEKFLSARTKNDPYLRMAK
jgi:hypothetical protein